MFLRIDQAGGKVPGFESNFGLGDGNDNAVDAICHGASLAAPGIVKLSSRISDGALLVIKSLKQEAVALGRALVTGAKMLKMTHGIAVKTERVLMEQSTYPALWKKKSI